MDRKSLLKRILPLILLIFVFNYIANSLYWYSSIWYFDMPMHFFGGFWLGLAFLWLFSKEDLSLKFVSKIILGVLLIGAGWEIFEILVNNYTTQNPFNTLDTISDIFFDLSGGSFALLYFFKKITPITEIKV